MLASIVRYSRQGITYPEWSFWVYERTGHLVEIEITQYSREYRAVVWGSHRYTSPALLAVVPRVAGRRVSILDLLRQVVEEL